jgi:pimeloyl-ACP methyl ester carboxylesterase
VKENRMPELRTLACAALLATLAACGSHGGAPTPAAPPGAAAPAPAAPDPGEGPRITLSKDNVHLEYRVYGRGLPVVLLVHGWACNGNYWNQQLDALKGRYTAVTLNLAGHGGSENNRTDWSIANYAADVAAVARQLPPDAPLVLVGHGMGAVVALEALPLIGTRVTGVIVVDALRSVGLPPLPAREVEPRIAPFRADFIGATRALVTDSLFPKDADRLLVQKVAYDMSLARPQVAVASMQSLLSLDLAPVLAAVHVPVYAINSDLQPTDVARIRKSLPEFTLDVVPHTGHFLMLEAPARFNPLLLADLSALAQRQPPH